MWHKKYNKNKIKYTRLSKKFIIIVFSILFGLSYMITPVLKENTKDIPLNVFLFLTGFFIFYLSIIIVTFAVKWYHLKNKDKELVCGDKLFFLLICMLNMMIGMVYLLIYYPGVGMYDSVSILTDSNLSMAVQHPWFYCMLIRGLVNIVFFFGGDYEVAFVVQSIIQM